MIWPAPNCWRRSRSSRRPWTAASARPRCRPRTPAAIRQVSQLPHGGRRAGRSTPAAARGGTRRSRTAPAWRPGARPSRRRCAASPSEPSIIFRCWTTSWQPVGQPGGGRQPVPAGAAGLLVVALDGLGQVEVGDEADVGLVDAHAERDGGHHRPGRPRAGTATGSPPASARPGPRGTAAPAMPLRAPGTRRSSPPTPATGSRRCRRRPRARSRSSSSSCLLRLVLRHDPVLDVGPVEAGHEVPGVVQAQPGAISACVACGRGRGQRDPRHRRASARAASTAPGSRGGSRAPTGTRSAPRRWRTGRSCRGRAARSVDSDGAAAPAPGRAGPARRRGTPPRPRAARRGPASS